MPKAIRLFGFIALPIGTPREIGSLPSLPDKWESAPTWAV